MKYKIIDESKSKEITALAICLTNEIIERTGVQHFDIDVPLAMELCQNYISNGLYTVIAAIDDEKIIGFGAVCESHSLYAEGAFGIIQEFYVLPDYRSNNIGKALIKEIVNFANSKNWKSLELCTPPVPEFDRTVSFYQSIGFKITGGYKMKYSITP